MASLDVASLTQPLMREPVVLLNPLVLKLIDMDMED